MIKDTYDIHIERLEELYEKLHVEADDIIFNSKRVKEDLFHYNPLSMRTPRADRLKVDIHVAQEDIQNTIANFQMILDELEDIEDEVNKDEVNNAGE